VFQLRLLGLLLSPHNGLSALPKKVLERAAAGGEALCGNGV
jgi:hypothetical protein